MLVVGEILPIKRKRDKSRNRQIMHILTASAKIQICLYVNRSAANLLP
jgi:hypothetical protein